MSYVLPNDLSNVCVNMPIRAQTMLVNGYPVQSVAQFDTSSNAIEISQMYYYAPAVNGKDPYYIDMSGTSPTSSTRKINQIYKEADDDMKVNPILHSNRYALNRHPII
jgi:hypothetical protein